jgi:hypothetical protein
MMTVAEMTIPSPDFPSGHTFGPVTIELTDGAVDLDGELPVTFAPEMCVFLGVRWFPDTYRTRGVFAVRADQIIFRPTARVVAERAAWWRRAGYSLIVRLHLTRAPATDARRRTVSR